jgi:prepilin-type N-terminal cleavage/methylation domain-containing protein
MIKLRKSKQKGFTLLELIVVIGLLGLVTSLASDFVINETNQQRFNTTKQRMEQIRYAIIGDSSRSLNGQPTISGFIADTGRVPASIENLMSNVAYCSVPTAFNQVDCEALAAYPSTSDATWNIGYCSDHNQLTETDCVAQNEEWNDGDANWKGPYLRPTGYKTIKTACDSSGVPVKKVPVFQDGWGNVDKNSADCTLPPHQNFGWNFYGGIDNANSPSTLADIKLQSLGLGGKEDEDPNINIDKYEDDYPPTGQNTLVHKNEFSIAYKKISIEFDPDIISSINEILYRTKLGGALTPLTPLTPPVSIPFEENTIFHEIKIDYTASGAEPTTRKIMVHPTMTDTIKLP